MKPPERQPGSSGCRPRNNLQHLKERVVWPCHFLTPQSGIRKKHARLAAFEIQTILEMISGTRY
jgi:hypothetical protein